MKRRIITLAVILAMLLSVFTLCATAATSDDSIVEWDISEDGKELARYDGEDKTVYHRLNIGQNRYSLHNHLYYFADEIVIDGEYYLIVAANHNSDTVYLESMYTGEVIPYSRDGEDALIAFIMGEYEVARIFYRDSVAITDKEFVGKLDAISSGGYIFPVSELHNAELLEVYTYDSDDILSHLHGAIYLIDDVPYYVNYDALGNSYFDSNGYFSYTKGEVTLYPLSGDIRTEYDALLNNMEYYEYKISYEDEGGDLFEEGLFELDEASALVLLIIVTVIFGIAIPVAPFVISLINLLKKKAKHVFVSYVSFIASAVWLVLGITVLILVIFAL